MYLHLKGGLWNTNEAKCTSWLVCLILTTKKIKKKHQEC